MSEHVTGSVPMPLQQEKNDPVARTVPITLQQDFWNRWNAADREHTVGEASIRQAEEVCEWLAGLGRTDLNIIEVGCGTGWLCPHLKPYGRVTATDLSDDVLVRAQERMPDVTFVAGDFMALDFGASAFDVVVSLEALAHIADQKAFVAKLARLLRPGGHLMLATQNRFVLQYLNRVPPPGVGQIRKWVSRGELRDLLHPEFEILELFTITPQIGRGLGLRRLIEASGLGFLKRALLGRQIETAETSEAPVAAPAARKRPSAATRGMEAMGLGWTIMALCRKR